METIEELKAYLSQHVGTPQRYGIAVGATIFMPDDTVLLLERGPQARDGQGKLEGAGGALAAGETNLHDALRREIEEEVGITVSDITFLVVKILKGTEHPWAVVDYVCRLASGTPTNKEPGKINCLRFVSLQAMQEDELTEYQKVAMQAYRKQYGSKPFYKV